VKSEKAPAAGKEERKGKSETNLPNGTSMNENK